MDAVRVWMVVGIEAANDADDDDDVASRSCDCRMHIWEPDRRAVQMVQQRRRRSRNFLRNDP